MEIEIQLTNEPIAGKISPPSQFGSYGAWLEFRGVVRDEENGQTISALEYEAYSPMAENEMRRILEALAEKLPCLAVKIIHRVGTIPAGETAIYVGIAAKHRGQAIALLAEFMDRLKQDVPIWKRRGIAVKSEERTDFKPTGNLQSSIRNLEESLAEIHSRCQPLPAARVSLEESFGRVLRETIFAAEDFPSSDRSTRDGYAILQNDTAEHLQIVDTIHATDWKPRQLKSGETVRVATGAALPCDSLRVVMQENVERDGDKIKIARDENSTNVRRRGEEIKAGQILLRAGSCINTGASALLATAGCVNPLVSPKLRILHFTTGDEIVPPDQTPKPGQIRDSNSFLIRGLLENFNCELVQKHLPEDFEQARQIISTFNFQPSAFNPILISGGASVGEKDFTRELLERLGFEIIFSQVNIRPGRPLIFGVNENRIAFGLPGNPLSHFVCFHLFVATALAKLNGAEPKKFLRGQLAEKLNDAPCPRETLWPARLDLAGLHPLAWASSGDITCLTETDALIRVPANRGSIDAGTEVEFLPT
jgi:molybdopterin molybdotransferase